MEDMSELTAEEQAKLLRHELEAVYGSSSYKIGRAVTWLPRNAKRGLKYLLHGDRADRAFFSRGIDPRNRLPSADSFPQAAVFHQILPILLRAIPPAFVKPARLCGKAFLFVCQQSHRAES